MSIENNLASIAKSLETIAAHISADKQDSRRTEVVTGGQIPVPAPAPTPIPAAAPAVPMPVPAPAAVPAPVPTSGTPAPFNDEKSLMEYVMGKYRTLGPVKGAMIQNCLSEVGVKNIKEVTPDMYGVFFHKVEALG